jgi:hypothetical protein
MSTATVNSETRIINELIKNAFALRSVRGTTARFTTSPRKNSTMQVFKMNSVDNVDTAVDDVLNELTHQQITGWTRFEGKSKTGGKVTGLKKLA